MASQGRRTDARERLPDPILEIASDLWEAPDDIECADYQVDFIDTPR